MPYCNKCNKRMMRTQHAKTGICWDCHNEKTYGKILPNEDGTYGKMQKNLQAEGG